VVDLRIVSERQDRAAGRAAVERALAQARKDVRAVTLGGNERINDRDAAAFELGTEGGLTEVHRQTAQRRHESVGLLRGEQPPGEDIVERRPQFVLPRHGLLQVADLIEGRGKPMRGTTRQAGRAR
jgi:hypothetical protein